MGAFGSRGSFLSYLPVREETVSDAVEVKCIEGDRLPAQVEDIHYIKVPYDSKEDIREK